MKYIIYNKVGNILRVVECVPVIKHLQVKEDEFIMEGTANDVTQKVVNGKVVDKTPKEIEVVQPPEPRLLKEKQPAYITNEQWQDVLKKLDKLETCLAKNDE